MNTVIKKLSYNGHSHQGANQAMLHKRNIANVSQTQHTASLRLITPVCSGGKGQVPRNQNLTPLRACFHFQTRRAKSALGKETQTSIPFALSSGLLRKPWISLAPNTRPVSLFLFSVLFPACLYVHQVYVYCLSRLEGGIGSPGTGVKSCCEQLGTKPWSSARPVNILF